MNKIVIEEKNVEDYIFDTLYSVRANLENFKNAKYHHNTSYENAPLVCKYGICSLLELNRLGLRNDSNEILEKFNDTESHINGNDGISLSVVGLTDLYKDEEEYNPFNPMFVDFLIPDSVKAHRYSSHYGNEFITYNNIKPEDILSLDFRILEYISLKEKNRISNDKLVDMYNNLLRCAKNIKKKELEITLREMSSHNSFSIDIDRLAQADGLSLIKIA